MCSFCSPRLPIGHWKNLPSVSSITAGHETQHEIWPDSFLLAVFEGEKIREEQQKRIEDQIHEEDIPVPAISVMEKDEEVLALHVERSTK